MEHTRIPLSFRVCKQASLPAIPFCQAALRSTQQTTPGKMNDDAGGPSNARRERSRRRANAARGECVPSQTVTIQPSDEAGGEEQQGAPAPAAARAPPTLRLRLHRRRVQWTNETHDNEHDGKKSSKSCCIFHKQRAFGESSSESENDKSDASGDEPSGGSSSSGGQRRRPNAAHVRGKLREMEREEMRREIAQTEGAEGS